MVTEVRLFKLGHADAAKLVPLLQAVFSESPAAAPGAEGLRTQVTRLRTVLEKSGGHTSEVPKTRLALTIQGDTATQTLVVAARSDVMPLIADMVAMLDVPGAGGVNAVRIMPLVNADATRLKQVIDGLYTGAQRQRGQARGPPDDLGGHTAPTRWSSPPATRRSR